MLRLTDGLGLRQCFLAVLCDEIVPGVIFSQAFNELFSEFDFTPRRRIADFKLPIRKRKSGRCDDRIDLTKMPLLVKSNER
jgi:hypothetical protein